MQIPDKIPDNQLPLSPVDRHIDLLGAESNIHSPADAETYINAILAKYHVDAASVSGLAPLEHRLAAAEYASLTDPSKRIPEARIVDAFNQLMDDWGAEPWTRIAVADFHRFHRIKAGTLIPYSVSRNSDGTVADSCRPIEALYLLSLLTMDRGMQGSKPPDLPENFGRGPTFLQSARSIALPPNIDSQTMRRNDEYAATRNAWLQGRFNRNPAQELGHLFIILVLLCHK